MNARNGRWPDRSTRHDARRDRCGNNRGGIPVFVLPHSRWRVALAPRELREALNKLDAGAVLSVFCACSPALTRVVSALRRVASRIRVISRLAVISAPGNACSTARTAGCRTTASAAFSVSACAIVQRTGPPPSAARWLASRARPWRVQAGELPLDAGYQLDWLISITAISVVSGFRTVRDRLRSFGLRMGCSIGLTSAPIDAMSSPLPP